MISPMWRMKIVSNPSCAFGCAALAAAGFDITASVIPGDAESIIAKTVQEQCIDVLVMGAFGHSPLRSMLCVPFVTLH